MGVEDFNIWICGYIDITIQKMKLMRRKLRDKGNL
jgi:ribosomal protein L10